MRTAHLTQHQILLHHAAKKMVYLELRHLTQPHLFIFIFLLFYHCYYASYKSMIIGNELHDFTNFIFLHIGIHNKNKTLKNMILCHIT